MDTTAQHAAVILEITSSFTTTVPPPPLFLHPLQQEATPTPTPTTFRTTTSTYPTVTLPKIPNFSSVFKFNQRVSAIESELSELKQINQFAEAVSSILGIVDSYIAYKMKEVVDVDVQLQTNKLREEAQAENQEFLNQVDSTKKKIIKDQVKAQVSKIMPKIEKYVTESLGAEVLVRSTNQPQIAYAVATLLSEFELKKILIDKMEANKSINRSDNQKNLYNALVVSYNSNKDIMSSYGDVVLLKRGRDDQAPPLDQTEGQKEGNLVIEQLMAWSGMDLNMAKTCYHSHYSSDESVGSSISRVILFGSIPIEVPVVSADLSATPKVGAAVVASPAGLLELDTHSPSESGPSEGLLPSVPIAPMVLPFLCSDDSESDTELPKRHVSSTPHDAMVARWRSRDIHVSRLYRTYPSGICRALTERKTVGSSPSYRMALRSALLSTMYPPMTSESSAGDSSSKSSVGQSHKRCRSPTATAPLAIPALGALVPTRADLLSPRKRFKDSYSSEDSIEEDIDADVLADIKTNVGVDAGIGMEVSVDIVSKDKEKYDAESSTRDIIEIRMDRVIERVVADDIVKHTSKDYPDLISADGSKGVMHIGLDMAIQELYDHMHEILVDRITNIKVGQRQLKVDSLIASVERVGLLDRVATLDRRNTRLRDTLRMESIMTITRSGMTPEAIKELIAQRVAEALAAYKANHAARLVVERQSQNGDDGDNGNDAGNGERNGGGNVNGNGNGNENPNRNDRGAMPVARECTYHYFMKCQPLNFKGTEGVVGLTRWFEKIEKVFHISNYLEKYHVKYATCTLLNSALTWWNSHKRTIRAEAAFSMSWRELIKLMTKRFQELTMLCTKMVSEEEDRVEKFIGGLPDNIQGNVIVVEPTRLQDAIRIANNLMDQKLKGYAARSMDNKIRHTNNQKDKRVQQPPYKRQNVGGQNVARAYMAGNNERKGYVRPWPYCKKSKLHYEGQCTVRCSNYKKVRHMARDCKAVGHYRSDCPKLKNQNHGNKIGNKTNEARRKAYALVGGDANPDFNVVTGTFLLNNRYAPMLYDSGTDRSFVSSTFIALFDVTPSTLDVSYAVKLVDGRIAETNTTLRGCTLGLLGHPFNIDLFLVELGSFDVIIGMDWLVNRHAVTVYDEKIIRIPCGDEVLIVQVTEKKTEDKSEEKRLEDVLTVRDFLEVFPEEFPRLPLMRQVEFQMDLVPGDVYVARAPYRLAPSELQELYTQLQELSDKGFIRPSSSPWGALVLFVKKM
ncbi:reverse transcriptase domain-containing protein [Tanacetum coccineum]